MIYDAVDGVKIHYLRKEGVKPCVVFIHGLAGSSESWLNQSRFLPNEQLLVDLRGHGDSGKPKGRNYYSFDKLVSDVKGVINKEGVKDYVIVGFSLGGLVALSINARKTILINPAIGRESLKSLFILQVWFSRYLPRSFIKRFEKTNELFSYAGFLDAYATMLLRTPSHVYLSIISNLPSFKSLNVSNNLVVIQSMNDEIIKGFIPFNHKLIKVKGHHYVIAENPKVINELLKTLIV